MLKEQQLLRIPGPTPIPPSVQRAMSQQMIGHRDQETKELIQRIKPQLKPVFGTEEEVMIIAGSGTAALETAVVNTVKPGDEVLVIITGSFGDRFAKICDAYEITVHRLETPWGDAADPKSVTSFLEEHDNIKAVFATYCETSTGVLNPVDKLAETVHNHSDALFIVDGVSCLGAVKSKMDTWGIDLLVTGSQKAMMLPPGLAFIAASKRAWKVIEENPHPRFYLDLKKYRDNLANDSTPFTPAISLLFGLEKALEQMHDEGLQEIYTRHQLMMNMTRTAFRELGIPLLTADEAGSPTVTAMQPEDFKADELRKILKKEFGLSIAGGQNHLKGKIFRIGHMGYCSPADILQAISLIEIGLRKIGKQIELGKGVQAAQKMYINNSPMEVQ
ncbi:pyridoxal-phosphate-dependent aminotransferase family protein [Virgibacillus kimchii]